MLIVVLQVAESFRSQHDRPRAAAASKPAPSTTKERDGVFSLELQQQKPKQLLPPPEAKPPAAADKQGKSLVFLDEYPLNILKFAWCWEV